MERRTLRFNQIQQATADAATLVEAETNGRLKCAGNWTLGQNLNHLAKWVDYSYEGAPMKIPWFIRAMGPIIKNRMLNKPMSAGFKIPGVKNGTLAIDAVPSAPAFAHFQSSMEKLSKQLPPLPHPFLGKLSHEQWIALHLRHSELHLSFMSAD